MAEQDRRAVLAVNSRGLMLGLDSTRSWILYAREGYSSADWAFSGRCCRVDGPCDVGSGWPRGIRQAMIAASGRRFRFDIGGHGPALALKHMPLRSSWSLDGVVMTGVGQAAWRYSWMSPPSTLARSTRASCSILAGMGSAAGMGMSRSMPRCGRAVL
jgi:hypothetical protein